jgi:hypothetical protein
VPDPLVQPGKRQHQQEEQFLFWSLKVITKSMGKIQSLAFREMFYGWPQLNLRGIA